MFELMMKDRLTFYKSAIVIGAPYLQRKPKDDWDENKSILIREYQKIDEEVRGKNFRLCIVFPSKDEHSKSINEIFDV